MPKMSVKERREHAADEESGGWVCDRCGETAEECLIMWTTGRVTRSNPSGDEYVVCLCDGCYERTPHGRVVHS